MALGSRETSKQSGRSIKSPLWLWAAEQNRYSTRLQKDQDSEGIRKMVYDQLVLFVAAFIWTDFRLYSSPGRVRGVRLPGK
jgi:hypothetical protein